jgi:hypothetical protein
MKFLFFYIANFFNSFFKAMLSITSLLSRVIFTFQDKIIKTVVFSKEGRTAWSELNPIHQQRLGLLLSDQVEKVSQL